MFTVIEFKLELLYFFKINIVFSINRIIVYIKHKLNVAVPRFKIKVENRLNRLLIIRRMVTEY